jgi:serine/threonine protein kinase
MLAVWRSRYTPGMTEPAVRDTARDMIGAVIEGRFRLVARLGDGSIGAVYRAEDLAGGEPMAIKIWHTSVLDGQAVGRFHRETKALATLEHPHIVAIRDYGSVEGMPYLAMELLVGESLAERLARGRLQPEQALAILRQMLEALRYAHERSVVHRDLKPENVFLVDRADHALQVKLLDYGLAKFLQVEDDPVPGAVLTRRGMMVGTPLYVAPEQALGAAIDARADVYSVGCVLYEMLTAEPPFFTEDIPDLLRAHLAAPIPKLTALVPELERADELQGLIERAMAKKASERFAHAGEMLEALPPAVDPPRATQNDGASPMPQADMPSKPKRGAGLPLLALGFGLALLWLAYRIAP